MESEISWIVTRMGDSVQCCCPMFFVPQDVAKMQKERIDAWRQMKEATGDRRREVLRQRYEMITAELAKLGHA